MHRNFYGTTRARRAQPCSFRFCHLDEKIGLATSVRTVETRSSVCLRLSPRVRSDNFVGYWINRALSTARCYECQFQFVGTDDTAEDWNQP